jgi:hypothetical protein
MSKFQKLTPDRDLQCYFRQPSAVAALSRASETGFTVSGCWREQFDWAVVEWNRDNVFEHPVFRNLPDGDLSGVHLTYDETRSNCIPLDSSLFATVDWPSLRVWADPNDGTGEHVYFIPLKDHATAASGEYTAATATFTLGGTAANNDYVELVCDGEHFTYQFLYGDVDLAHAIAGLVSLINNGNPPYSGPSQVFTAAQDGTTITLTWKDATAGANANRTAVYAGATGAVSWSPAWQNFAGGASPTQWHIDLDFRSPIPGYQLMPDSSRVPVDRIPMDRVRKLRWTWAADLQPGSFQRGEFQVDVTNWTVSGTNLEYQVAGPGSWRVEDDDPGLKYTGDWHGPRDDRQYNGNYSGGSIHCTVQKGAAVSCSYQANFAHTLYLGTRYAEGTASATVVVDGGTPQAAGTSLAGEDVLVRVPLAALDSGKHTVTVTVNSEGTFWFDFFEIAVPTPDLPSFEPAAAMTLATDWDTLHSQALPPERTAWLVRSLGFTGRANHYIGALWWYEVASAGQYATATVTLGGGASFGCITTITLGTAPNQTQFAHVNYITDTPESIAKAFELLINEGATGIWASAEGAALTITSRVMGAAGNLTVAVDTGSASLTQTVSTADGADAPWLTDLAASPRINRAARDWCAAYYAALQGSGIDVAAAFSTELGNGDPSTAAGIAQRYPDGSACLVNTPALQTNFSPASLAFWQQAYADMADLMAGAGIVPYLQFGEVQWWYFCPPTDPANGDWTPLKNGGMPFYDDYTKSAFESQYERPMHVFLDPADDPAPYPEESAFLPGLIGQFTAAIMDFVRQAHPDARFEVLYPPDTNDAPLTRVVNLPAGWTPANLDCFKTENFTYTGNRDLDKARTSIALPARLGFPPGKSAHLVGIGDHTAPWDKESRLANGQKLGSVVLFALDQFCLIGYGLPLRAGSGRSLFMGA